MAIYSPLFERKEDYSIIWSWLVQPLPFNEVTTRTKEGPLAKLWKPIPVTVVRGPKTGDFYQIMTDSDFAVNETALKVLQEHFAGQFEALPLKTVSRTKVKLHRENEKSLFAIHPLQYVPLAKGAQLKPTRFGLTRVTRYQFRERELAGKDIFKVAGRSEIILSARFRSVVKAAKLRGLGFERLRS